MNQLGNLAIVCANRPEVLLQIYDGLASVNMGQGPNRTVLSTAWDNHREIRLMIHELSLGQYRGDQAA